MRGGRGRNCRKDTAGWHVPQDDKFRYLLRRYEGNTWILKRYLLFYLHRIPSLLQGITFVGKLRTKVLVSDFRFVPCTFIRITKVLFLFIRRSRFKNTRLAK